MEISVDRHWETFVADLVASGRFGSASEVIQEGLRLMERREAKLKALRETLNASIERGGDYSLEDIEAMIDRLAAESQAKVA